MRALVLYDEDRPIWCSTQTYYVYDATAMLKAERQTHVVYAADAYSEFMKRLAKQVEDEFDRLKAAARRTEKVAVTTRITRDAQRTFSDKCRFCLEEKGDNSSLKGILGGCSSVLYETRHWFVVPSVGGFVEGYLLIVCKDHIPSMACCTGDQLDDLERVIGKCSAVLRGRYRDEPVLFEHGVPHFNCGSGANSVDHLHIHILPNRQGKFKPKAHVGGREVVAVKSLSGVGRWMHESGCPYLFVQEATGERWLCSSEGMDSQYLRKAFCADHGIDKWNWRDEPCKELFLRTLVSLKGAF